MKGKTVLITGASRGIGRAIARRLAAEGAAVVLSASRMGKHGELEGTLEDAVGEIEREGGRAAAVAGNLVSEEERADLVARAAQCFGPIDVLINNAAMGRWGMPSQASLKDRRKMMEVNLQAPVDLAQQAIPAMRERGGGAILSISSDTARQFDVPYRDSPEAAHVVAPYGATKAALNRYMQGLAHELAPDSIFVNTLAPVAIVLTQEAARFVGHIAEANPDMVEPVETMAEAALELVSRPHVGQVAYSRHLLHSVGRKVRSLDGEKVLGDAFLPADLSVLETAGG